MIMKPHFESFSSSSSKASTWNRLSHMYMDLSPQLLTRMLVSISNLRVDGLEGLERKRQLLLLALLIQDGTDEHAKTIVGHSVEELELLLGGRDGRQDREPVGNQRIRAMYKDFIRHGKTDLLTRDLMLDAVPYSVVNMLFVWEICDPEEWSAHCLQASNI